MAWAAPMPALTRLVSSSGVNKPSSPVPCTSTSPSGASTQVQVQLGGRVLGVAQIQAQLALHPAQADGRHLARGADPQGLEGQSQGHPAPADGGAAGAAVGHQHVAVQAHGVPGQGGEVHGHAQAAPDEPADLLGPALLPVLATGAGCGWSGAAWRTRRSPSPCPSPPASWESWPPGRRAQHLGLAERGQAGALGVGVDPGAQAKAGASPGALDRLAAKPPLFKRLEVG